MGSRAYQCLHVARDGQQFLTGRIDKIEVRNGDFMKVVQINSVCESGSTGKICVAISELLTAQGIENYIFHTSPKCHYPTGKQYMSLLEVKIQAFKAKMFGKYGFQSKGPTRRLIRSMEKIEPDIVQLHNLHGHNIHLGMLFSYFKRKRMKIFWTFHDCWAFTSYCMYFDMIHCDRWVTGCQKCPLCKKYTWFFDRSKWLYKTKRELFSGLDLNIITPSQWLANLVKKSFLKEYPVTVIHNGVDLKVFTPRISNFRERYGISSNKIILLGVANRWEQRKGLDVFIRLAERLDANKFQIVLVGTDHIVDEKLPPCIISIHRTADQHELSEIYSTADFFINPTREDNFPTVNIESLACGTPVITFDTGGCPEAVTEDCGIVIQKGNFNILYNILNRENDFVFSQNDCLNRSLFFDQDKKFKEYVDLYCASK